MDPCLFMAGLAGATFLSILTLGITKCWMSWRQLS